MCSGVELARGGSVINLATLSIISNACYCLKDRCFLCLIQQAQCSQSWSTNRFDIKLLSELATDFFPKKVFKTPSPTNFQN